MRLDTFFIAGLLTAPALKEAFFDDTMAVEDALLRYVIALFLVGVGMGVVRSVYYGYAASAPRRRRSDRAPIVPDPRLADLGETLTPVESESDESKPQHPAGP